METISITIPMEERALLKTADYLRNLAGVEAVGAISVGELSPEAEAEAMGDRIDETVAAATTSAPPAPPTATPAYDAKGSLWDARIHASSKALIADGTWRLKRGVDPALVTQVEAELQQGEEPVVETPTPIAPLAPTPVETPAPLAPPAADSIPPAPVTGSTLPAPPAPIGATYPNLVQMVTEQVNAKKLQPRDVLDAIHAAGADLVGCTSIVDLAKEEYKSYVPLVADELRKIWTIRG